MEPSCEYAPDIEVQYTKITDEVSKLEELVNSFDAILARYNKLKQRRNQLKILVDIHRDKLRVYRTDNGERLNCCFN